MPSLIVDASQAASDEPDLNDFFAKKDKKKGKKVRVAPTACTASSHAAVDHPHTRFIVDTHTLCMHASPARQSQPCKEPSTHGPVHRVMTGRCPSDQDLFVTCSSLGCSNPRASLYFIASQLRPSITSLSPTRPRVIVTSLSLVASQVRECVSVTSLSL